jgi:hypothetical protein
MQKLINNILLILLACGSLTTSKFLIAENYLMPEEVIGELGLDSRVVNLKNSGFNIFLKCENSGAELSKLVHTNGNAFGVWDDEKYEFRYKPCNVEAPLRAGLDVREGDASRCSVSETEYIFSHYWLDFERDKRDPKNASQRFNIKETFEVSRTTGSFKWSISKSTMMFGGEPVSVSSGICYVIDASKLPKKSTPKVIF